MEKNKTIIIKDNILIHEDREILFEALYTNGFYEYLNSIADNFNFGTVIDNVIFEYYLRPMLSFVFYLKKNEIEYVEIKKTSKKNKRIIASASAYFGIPCNAKSAKIPLCKHIYNSTLLLLAAIYLFFFSLSEKYLPNKKRNGCDVWIIRDDAIRQKVYERDNTIVLEESRIGCGSLYQNIKRAYRWINILKSYKRAKREYCLIQAVLNENKLSGLSTLILPYFAKRLTHIFYWGYSLETLIENGSVGNSVITGNFCDAYAEVEKRVSRKYKKKLVVFPHGLEDGYKLPNGYTGDVFYATTEYSCNYLNRLYQTNKFVYDEFVINSMLRKNYFNDERKCVFFTDGTGNELDIEQIMHISKFLKQHGQKLYIKLHPHEKDMKYKGIANTDYIRKIEEALCGNICISRGSTVLIEAIYNKSVPLQTLIGDNNLACANVIPSLVDEHIAHVSSYEELDALILDELIKERLIQ